MEYYYINLDRRKERNKHVLSEIKKSKVLSKKIKRISAVDGLSLNIQNIPDNILTKKSKEQLLTKREQTFGISLTHGAVGCAMSHYKLYEKCIEKNENFLILEDDIIINPGVDEYIEDYLDYFNYDLLYLGFHRHSHTILKNVHPLINKIKGNIWGTFAYVVTPKFCKYCIENVFPISVQFDTEISKHINKNKITAMAFNSNVISAVHLGTDIQGNDGFQQENIQEDDYAWNSVFEW